MYPKYLFKNLSIQPTIILDSLTDSHPQTKEHTWLSMENSVGNKIKT